MNDNCFMSLNLRMVCELSGSFILFYFIFLVQLCPSFITRTLPVVFFSFSSQLHIVFNLTSQTPLVLSYSSLLKNPAVVAVVCMCNPLGKPKQEDCSARSTWVTYRDSVTIRTKTETQEPFTDSRLPRQQGPSNFSLLLEVIHNFPIAQKLLHNFYFYLTEPVTKFWTERLH